MDRKPIAPVLHKSMITEVRMEIHEFYICICSPQHGICKSGLTGPDTARLDSSWVGIYAGEATLLCDHIRRAVELAAANPPALLIFSGGDTNGELMGRSEAESAFEIARDHGWFGHPEVAKRCHLDKDARCSAQNLEFATFLHQRLTGRFPTRVIVIGWGFKGTRFSAHAAGLRFLENGIEYIGVNNPPKENFEVALTGELEKLRAIVADKDWLLSAPRWQTQRDRRNPLNVKHPYDSEIESFIG